VRLVRVLDAAPEEGLPVVVVLRTLFVVGVQPEELAGDADQGQVGHERDGVEGLDELEVDDVLDALDDGQPEAVHDDLEDVGAALALFERVVEVVHPGGLRTTDTEKAAGGRGSGSVAGWSCMLRSLSSMNTLHTHIWKPLGPRHARASSTAVTTSCWKARVKSTTLVPMLDGQGGLHRAQASGAGSPPSRAVLSKSVHLPQGKRYRRIAGH
tara:strand:+ start:5732 stop:6367 length:636 start_codon:yes stop_codon:yes gene_type:complete